MPNNLLSYLITADDENVLISNPTFFREEWMISGIQNRCHVGVRRRGGRVYEHHLTVWRVRIVGYDEMEMKPQWVSQFKTIPYLKRKFAVSHRRKPLDRILINGFRSKLLVFVLHHTILKTEKHDHRKAVSALA